MAKGIIKTNGMYGRNLLARPFVGVTYKDVRSYSKLNLFAWHTTATDYIYLTYLPYQAFNFHWHLNLNCPAPLFIELLNS
jgi:hypothetical protein